ncbi:MULTISPECIES: class I SAM-dependent methyltransferase [Janibacter]|uniref:class I SAM-dependent methyltransferase n=1 Tax=Janibacter TaxID=53457 RepID=UPI001E5F9B39|nr:class I SAM-dependent methyltransferase [Janibacter melonis]MCB5990055.1 class I SAM-dependent methyltransferase [Janibacter melonis]
MDLARFLDGVEEAFAGDPQDNEPVDARYGQLVQDVAGYTSAAELAVLNVAARLLPPDECYLEVGSYKGRSMCGAVQGVDDRVFYVLENYLEFGMQGEQARQELHDNLARHAAHADVRLLEGNCFELLRRPGLLDRPVGVYFYDGEHTATSHYLALGMIEPWLADEALVLVDDATYPMVSDAHDAYIARHPQWRVERRWDARSNDDPLWANGLHALSFRRDAASARGSAETFDVRWRRLAYAGALGPGQKAAWKAIHTYPGLVPLAKKLYPSKKASTID